MKRNNSLKVNDNIIKQDFGYSKNILQWYISPDVWLSLMQIVESKYIQCVLFCCLVSELCLTLFVTPWTVACQAPLSLEHPLARILECVVISISRESSWPRDRTHIPCISRQILYHRANSILNIAHLIFLADHFFFFFFFLLADHFWKEANLIYLQTEVKTNMLKSIYNSLYAVVVL